MMLLFACTITKTGKVRAEQKQPTNVDATFVYTRANLEALAHETYRYRDV